MLPVIIAVLVVLAVCAVGAVFSARKLVVRPSGESAVMRELIAQMPGAVGATFQSAMGWIGASFRVGDSLYQMSGSSLEGEGGDGYLHVYRTRDGSKVELWRRDLESYRHWEDAIIHAIRDVAVVEKRPNQPPEPTAMSVTPPAAQEPRQP